MAHPKKTSFWKMLRVTILLGVLLIVLLNLWRDKNQDWSQPIFITLYPINADQSPVSQQYIQQLNTDDFQLIATYLQQQAQSYRPQSVNFYFRLGQQIHHMPPMVPAEGSFFDIMIWSLKFRYFSWKNHQDLGFSPSVELFLIYYDPKQNPVIKHSTALENGRIGIVNLFSSAKQTDQNHIVIAHEMLHAFGATDKYDLASGRPIFPIGYANPQKQPLYPQQSAEIMAVAVPLSETQYKMADHLQQTMVSQQTAQEIGWLKP